MGEARVNVGLLGVGAIGRIHATNLAGRVQGARLSAVADVDRAAAAACAAEFGVEAVFDGVRELVNDRRVDAVAVASPAATHAAAIEAAAAAGKHIFCEKPLAYDLDEIDRALRAVEKAGAKLQVGFNRRFDPGFRQAYETARSGKLGRLYRLHIVGRDPFVERLMPKAQGELLLETTVHDFDLARYMAGTEPLSVYAEGGAAAAAAAGMSGAAGIDTAVVVLRFPDGVIATIDNGQTAYGYDQRLELFGSKGGFWVGNETPYRALLADGEAVRSPLPLHFFPERYAESYVAEMAAFIDCVRNDAAPQVGGRDGRAAIVLALAAMRSLEEGRPVAVAEIAAL